MWNRCADVTPPKNELVLLHGGEGRIFHRAAPLRRAFHHAGQLSHRKERDLLDGAPPSPWKMTRSGGEE